MITILFACGHPPTKSDGTGIPTCAVCGCGQIARVTAPPPRITGWARGPYVVTDERLKPVAVTFAASPQDVKES